MASAVKIKFPTLIVLYQINNNYTQSHVTSNIFHWFSGTFALLQAYAFLVYLRSKVSWSDVKNIFFFAVVAVAGLVFVAVIFLTYAGKIDCF